MKNKKIIYEYQEIYWRDLDTDEILKEVNKEAKKGWRIKAAGIHDAYRQWRMLMEREVPEEDQ